MCIIVHDANFYQKLLTAHPSERLLSFPPYRVPIAHTQLLISSSVARGELVAGQA